MSDVHADPNYTTPKKFLERLKQICSKHPKGRAFTDKGEFVPDPTPIAPPIGYKPELDLFERMREVVRREISTMAHNQDFETFEEADDFEVYDDPEPFSPYELIVEQARPDGPTVVPDKDLASVEAKPAEPAEPASSAPPKPVDAPAAPPKASEMRLDAQYWLLDVYCAR